MLLTVTQRLALTACELPANSSWWPFADTDAAVTLKSMAGVVETTCSTFRLLNGVLASCTRRWQAGDHPASVGAWAAAAALSMCFVCAWHAQS